MERKNRRLFLIAGALLLLFIVFTIAVATFDVQAIGPNHSSVGFATINGFVFDELGTNVFWYDFTGLIGLVPILVVSCFAIVGLAQLIRRRSVKRMDADLLILAAFYCAVAACYVIFEVLVVNYRPILIGSELEASYPSSHTLLLLCVMATAVIQIRDRVGSKPLRTVLIVAALVIMAVMVIGRLLSGVHWLTDIVGSIVLASALVLFYSAACKRYACRPKHRRH